MSAKDQGSLFEARAERDEALERVAENAGQDFIRRSLSYVATMMRGRRVTGEDIRVELWQVGIRPHHHNAWGALIRQLVVGRIITPTGEYRQMRVPKSHARRTPVYTVRP